MTSARHQPRGNARTLLIRRARAIPLGLWSAEKQFAVRGIVADLLHELRNLIEENRALRGVRTNRPRSGEV